MKVVVFGAGGVGAYLGASLLLSGADVTFIARGANLEALQSKGLCIQSPAFGNVQLPTVQVTNDAHTVGPVDVVLLCVKMWAVESAAEACKPLIKQGHTVIITTQNGVDAPGIVSKAVGEEHVVAGSIRIMTRLVEPGVVFHCNQDARFAYGTFSGPPPPALLAFHNWSLSPASKFEGVLTEQIWKELWMKMALLASIAGVACLVRQPNGVVRSHPTTRQLLLDCIAEVCEVAQAEGHDLGPIPEVQAGILAAIDSTPPDGQPSTLSDLLAGQPVEAEWLSGAVVRIGARVGVATPVHAVIAAVMAPYANGPPTMPLIMDKLHDLHWTRK